ncbi:hypothetical protein BVI1335_2130003 [Burkholderia vietnamiensis]|nr:hypothetical protein BVI1335_2130003 [Burkholderia vietnamiensis]
MSKWQSVIAIDARPPKLRLRSRVSLCYFDFRHSVSRPKMHNDGLQSSRHRQDLSQD